MADEIDDGLTDEEREALKSTDDIIADGSAATSTDEDAELAAQQAAEAEAAKAEEEAQAAAAKKAEEEAAAAAEAAQGGDDAAKAAADAAAAEAAKKAEAEAAAAKKSTPETSAPLLVVQPVEDAEAKLKEISDKKSDLLTKFDDGDITAKEYQTELDALAKQERQIEWSVEKAKLSQEMEQQRQANEWNATVNRFIASNDRYSPEKSPRLYQLLDLEVRAVAVSDEFKSRTDAAAGWEILQRAHENLSKELGFSVETKPGGKQDKPIPHAKPEPSLHKLPAAEQSETNGGKYASLDRLAATDPIAYEEALMKLPEAERNSYLASA